MKKVLNNLESNNNCKTCKPSVHCCVFKNQSGFTFLTPNDAKRIKKETRKEFSHFIDYSSFPKKIINELTFDDPSLEGALRFSQLDKENRLLRLKTRKDGRCIFLNTKGLCDVYNIRPNICRIYPYWAIRLDNDRLKIISHDLNPKCLIVKNKFNLEETLTRKEQDLIKQVFKNIEKENKSYKADIKRFLLENNIL